MQDFTRTAFDHSHSIHFFHFQTCKFNSHLNDFEIGLKNIKKVKKSSIMHFQNEQNGPKIVQE